MQTGFGAGALSSEAGGVTSAVNGIQRARLVAAMMKAACEHGAGSVTVADVVAAAGVSRRTFYELFEDREACFLAAVDHAFERVGSCLLGAYRREGSWPERVRASVLAGASLLEAEPILARFSVVETLGGGQRALLRRQQALARLTSAVDEVRQSSRLANQAPPLTAESVVGAALSLLHTRMLEDGPYELMRLVNPLLGTVVLPYLGPAAARRELTRAPPERSRAIATAEADTPLSALGIRVTYRTVRTLAAIASYPGASNRRIGQASGMVDPGQASRLLGRLEKLGLIQNQIDAVVARGTPNAWRLTRRGRQVHDALSSGVDVSVASATGIEPDR